MYYLDLRLTEFEPWLNRVLELLEVGEPVWYDYTLDGDFAYTDDPPWFARELSLDDRGIIDQERVIFPVEASQRPSDEWFDIMEHYIYWGRMGRAFARSCCLDSTDVFRSIIGVR